jgi:NAD(P)-dependent dehydrogenase (short-subunit alcohol dehydrogenase family)
VRKAELLANVAGQAAAALGRVDIAINSAGVQNAIEFVKMSEEQFRRVVEINLFGSRNFAAAVLQHLQQGSQLVLVASLAGIVSNYGYTAYNASKFGVVGFAGALRLECQPKGIAVTVICPPEIETPMVEAERREAPAVTMKLKEFAGTLELEPAVREILAGLRAREFMVIPGSRARLTRRLAGMFPGLLRRISDDMVRKTLALGRQ